MHEAILICKNDDLLMPCNIFYKVCYGTNFIEVHFDNTK